MVGRVPDPARAGRLAFSAADDVVAVVGVFEPSSVGSELAKLRGEPLRAPLPPLNASAALAAHRAVREAVRSGSLSSAHDIAEGGIAVALAECCVAGGIGAHVELPDGLDPFAEALGRAFVVSGWSEQVAAIGDGQPGSAPVTVIGRVGGPALELTGVLDVPVLALTEARAAGLAALL
jgi:phosphoribosylformylglycinamidine synthase